MNCVRNAKLFSYEYCCLGRSKSNIKRIRNSRTTIKSYKKKEKDTLALVSPHEAPDRFQSIEVSRLYFHDSQQTSRTDSLDAGTWKVWNVADRFLFNGLWPVTVSELKKRNPGYLLNTYLLALINLAIIIIYPRIRREGYYVLRNECGNDDDKVGWWLWLWKWKGRKKMRKRNVERTHIIVY